MMGVYFALFRVQVVRAGGFFVVPVIGVVAGPPIFRGMELLCISRARAVSAMRQRLLGSHTPTCPRRMVITTQFSVLPCRIAALSGGGGVVVHVRVMSTPWGGGGIFGRF